MKYWAFSFLLLALGAGVLGAWHFLDFSFWFAAPGIVLMLLGLMPLSAAKEHARQQRLVDRGVDGARPQRGRAVMVVQTMAASGRPNSESARLRIRLQAAL